MVLAAAALLFRRGAPAADTYLAPFEVRTPAGGTLRSADFAGHIMLVNIWASWCAPCREELPHLDSLAARFDTARVAFVALSDDDDGAAAREFLLLLGPSRHLHIGFGLGRLKARYRYPGLPFTMLVGGDGRIVRRWFGFGGPPQVAAIDSLIRDLERHAGTGTPPGTPQSAPGR